MTGAPSSILHQLTMGTERNGSPGARRPDRREPGTHSWRITNPLPSNLTSPPNPTFRCKKRDTSHYAASLNHALPKLQLRACVSGAIHRQYHCARLTACVFGIHRCGQGDKLVAFGFAALFLPLTRSRPCLSFGFTGTAHTTEPCTIAGLRVRPLGVWIRVP